MVPSSVLACPPRTESLRVAGLLVGAIRQVPGFIWIELMVCSNGGENLMLPGLSPRLRRSGIVVRAFIKTQRTVIKP